MEDMDWSTWRKLNMQQPESKAKKDIVVVKRKGKPSEDGEVVHSVKPRGRYHNEADIIINRVKAFDPETIVTYKMLASWTDIRKKPTIYNIMRDYVKPALESTYGIFLETVRNEGYRVVKPGQEVDVIQSQDFNPGIRKMYRAVERTKDIRLSALRDKEKMHTIHYIQRMGNIVGMLPPPE